MARKSYHANRVLSEESKTAAEAVKYASDNNQVATVTETVRGFEVSIPSPSGVLAALMEKSTELHVQCAQILREIGDANDVRTRGQKRRHYNQLMKTIVEYQRVIGRLMDKNVVRDVWTVEEAVEETPEEEPKPKATKPKAKAKSKAKAKPKASGTSNRSKLEKMSYKELQAYCKKRNIGSGGTKAALIERILGRLGE